tara:strand:- start:142 stop:504 length:363 start_codon:yes stop_codon:yes gene_type:complete
LQKNKTMAILTIIDGIPLFTTIQEALLYGSENGLEGYHTHTFKGKIGYMGGATHPEKTIVQATTQTPVPTPVRQTRPIEQVRPVEQVEQEQETRRVARPQPAPIVRRTTTSTGGGGGGGY